MTVFICTACGTSFPPAERAPEACPICSDERQFVPLGGQGWTDPAAIEARHRGEIGYDGPLLGFGITPHFAIGQRALLLRTAAGNVLWDCIPFVDRAIVEIVTALGGLAAIAISHPHYYGRMEEWSAAFGNAPIYCHADDRTWAMNPGPNAIFWSGERHGLLPGVTLVRCGGHFDGGTVLHVAPGAASLPGTANSLAGFRQPYSRAGLEARLSDTIVHGDEGSQRGDPHSVDPLPFGALLSGDILQVTPGGTHVAFMRSYPNMIPLGAAPVRRIAAALAELPFDTVLGGFWGRVIATGGKAALAASVERHIRWVSDASSEPL